MSFPQAQVKGYTVLDRNAAYIRNIFIGAMLALSRPIHEYRHPTRVKQDGWGFLILHDVCLLPSKHGRFQRYIVADSDLRGTSV